MPLGDSRKVQPASGLMLVKYKLHECGFHTSHFGFLHAPWLSHVGEFLYLPVVVAHFAAIKGPTTSCDICLCQEKKRHNVLCMRAMFFKDTFAATSTAGFITMLGNTLLQRVYVAAKSTVSELCIHHSLHDPEAFDATNALRVQLAACISMRFCMHCWGAKQAK